jgi:hypothetical protein
MLGLCGLQNQHRSPVQRHASAPDAEFKVCRDCGGLMPVWRSRHVSRTCSGYSALWAGDQRIKLFAALDAYAAEIPAGHRPQVQMVTITAPGVAGGLGWDPAQCRVKGPHRHSGMIGCKTSAAPAAHFNELAPGWWRSLHHEARQAARRQHGPPPVLIARVAEIQRRGVLHYHVILGRSTPAEIAAASAYQRELTARAPGHGFGYVDRKLEVREPGSAAAYLSSYFVDGKKGKISLRESVTSPAMPRSIIHVAVALTQASGITMRTLRLRRFLWCRIGPGWLRHLDALDLDLSSAYEVVAGGYWGPAFISGAMQAAAAP